MANLLNSRISFWIDYWEDLIRNFLKKSYGLTLYSPHSLIEDIIIEIEGNEFKNSDNKKFFLKKLGSYYKEDGVIKESFYTEFSILIKIFNTDKTIYLHEESLLIFKKFSKGVYFDTALKLLQRDLNSSEPIDQKFISSITYITNNIIVELIKKGYDLEDIKHFARNVFDGYKENSDATLLNTNFPHTQKSDSFKDKNGKINWKKYNKAIRDEIDGVNGATRVKYLSRYYYKKTETVRYIFPIMGVRGNDIYTLDNVILYPIEKKRFIIDKDYQDFEQLHTDSDKNGVYGNNLLQVAVEVDYLLPQSSLRNALAVINNKIDLITFFFNTKTPIEVDTSVFIIEQKGKLRHSSHESKNKSLLNSLNLNIRGNSIKELNVYNFLHNKQTSNSKTESQLLSAIHWFSKAENALGDEDRLLNYWIAIENLFNVQIDIKNNVLEKDFTKLNLIQEIVLSDFIFEFLYDYGWDLYDRYQINEMHKSVPIPAINKFNIPAVLIKAANLCVSSGKRVYLKKFVTNIKKIKKYDHNLFYQDRIDDVYSFYHDSEYRLRAIHSQINTVKDDITMIYRFRNLIVHNAHFNNTLLPYYIWKIREYASNLIHSLLSMYAEEKLELHQMLIRIYQKKETFIKNTELGTEDLFRSRV